jgi:hypothetical protein
MLALNADGGAPDAAMLKNLGQNKQRRVGSDREADALGAHDDGGVDADDASARIDQRTAGIAGVESGVGLDHVIDQAAGAGAQGASNGADHARGHRLLEAEGVADGDGELARADRL